MDKFEHVPRDEHDANVSLDHPPLNNFRSDVSHPSPTRYASITKPSGNLTNRYDDSAKTDPGDGFSFHLGALRRG